MAKPNDNSRRHLVRRVLALAGMAVAAGAVLGGLQLWRQPAVQERFRRRAATAAVADYVDQSLLPTLDALATAAEQFDTAVQRLAAQPDDARLAAAVRAWQAAQGAWMRSVAFLFGPCAQYDYFKRIGAWPFEKVLAEHDLAEMRAGRLQVDARFLRTRRTAVFRGLYAAQYLLLREGRPRPAAALDPAELAYLRAVSAALREDCADFEASWCGTARLAPVRAELLRAAGIADKPAYADELKHPGGPGSRYASLSVSVQEIFQEIGGAIEDMLPLLEGLGATASPSGAYWEMPDPAGDLLEQARSLELAYLGGAGGRRDRSMATLVAAHDRVLDRLIRISLAHVVHRLEGVRAALGRPPAERELAVRVARGELDKLAARVGAATALVVLDPALQPYAAYRR